MAKRGHGEEEILRVLREAESGDTVVEVCRKHGISQQTFYLWKKKYAGLGLQELRELRQLREENGKLKRLVADLSLDRHILQEIVQGAWAMDTSGLCSERTPGGGADESHSKDFAIPEPTTSSGRSAGAAARAGHEPGAFRVSKADSDPEKRRLAGQSQGIYRLYTEDGLTVRTKLRKKLARRSRTVTPKATQPDQKWSMDFMSAKLVDGRWFRVLTVIDQFTRECLALVADGALNGHRVA
jgi:putative transposase